ncbi:hypothetical protein ASG81_03340 [Paenibacillus sp. Soil522]|nr:hypothetical protein ASG81_03340 [Paenibacillus sp. Soil522]
MTLKELTSRRDKFRCTNQLQACPAGTKAILAQKCPARACIAPSFFQFAGVQRAQRLGVLPWKGGFRRVRKALRVGLKAKMGVKGVSPSKISNVTGGFTQDGD